MDQLRRILVLFSVGLLPIGCGSFGNGAEPTEESLRDGVTAFAEKFLDAPASVYTSLSQACRESISREEFAGRMLLALGFLEGLYGVEIADLEVGEVKIRSFTPQSAEASVQFLDPDGMPLGDDSYSEWIFEDGEWRSTDCEEM